MSRGGSASSPVWHERRAVFLTVWRDKTKDQAWIETVPFLYRLRGKFKFYKEHVYISATLGEMYVWF